MKYAAARQADLRTGPLLRASNEQVGIWLRVYAYAAELELGGAIPDCRPWDDRLWLSTSMITRADLEQAVNAKLCEWRGDDLVVCFYDQDGERAVKAKRENGKTGGRPPKETEAKPIGEPEPNLQVSVSQTQAKPLSLPLPSPPIPSVPLRSLPSPDLPDPTGGDPTGAECAETAEPSSTPPPVLQFPTDGKVRSWNLTTDQIQTWRELFPALDIEGECRMALAWVLAKPNRRKTARGMEAFLVGWFSKSNDKRRSQPSNGHSVGQAPPETTIGDGDLLR